MKNLPFLMYMDATRYIASKGKCVGRLRTANQDVEFDEVCRQPHPYTQTATSRDASLCTLSQ